MAKGFDFDRNNLILGFFIGTIAITVLLSFSTETKAKIVSIESLDLDDLCRGIGSSGEFVDFNIGGVGQIGGSLSPTLSIHCSDRQVEIWRGN